MKRFGLWKLDGTIAGLLVPYVRSLYADPCAYCGGPGGVLDHIVPLADRKPSSVTQKGDWEDLTAACHACNVKKERSSLLEFLGWPRGWLS